MSGLTPCPRNGLLMVHTGSHVVRPVSCRSARCTQCGHGVAAQKAMLVTWATRQHRCRLVTLTGLPTTNDGELDWPATRWQVRDLRRRLARYPTQWAWAVERNPRKTGYHLHAVQHGSWIPQAELARKWGDRVVDIRLIRTPEAGTYITKNAARVVGYQLKGTSDLREHLELNGGRIVHYSRLFLGGRRADDVLAEIRGPSDPGEWLTFAATSLSGYLSDVQRELRHESRTTRLVIEAALMAATKELAAQPT